MVGCTTQKLLRADFEVEEVGDAPILNLPGNPAGDRLGCVDCDSGDYSIVAKDTPDGPSQWLQIFGLVRSSAKPRVITLTPIPGTLSNPIYTVSLKGFISHAGSNSTPFSLSFFSGTFTGSQFFFDLTFKRENRGSEEVSGIYLREGNANNEAEVRIGQVRSETVHSLAVFINVDNRTMTISGSGLPTIIERPIPSRITNVRAPHLYLSYHEFGVGIYQIDKVEIFERKREE